MRESATVKSRRYLAEGRVLVTHVDASQVRAWTRGDAAIHHQRWTRPEGWTCTCEARGRCSHLLAVGQVVAVDLVDASATPQPV